MKKTLLVKVIFIFQVFWLMLLLVVQEESMLFCSLPLRTVLQEKSVNKVSPNWLFLKEPKLWVIITKIPLPVELSVYLGWEQERADEKNPSLGLYFSDVFVQTNSIRVEMLPEAAATGPWAGFHGGIKLHQPKTGSCWYLRQKTHTLGCVRGLSRATSVAKPLCSFSIEESWLLSISKCL